MTRCIGTHDPAVPKSKRLLSNNQSNILVGTAFAVLLANSVNLQTQLTSCLVLSMLGIRV